MSMSLSDIRSAFPSLGHPQLDAVIDGDFEDESDKAILKGRHRRSFVLIQCHQNEQVLVWPGSGGLQGDSAMPEEFNSANQLEVDKWIRSTLKKEELFELPKCTQDIQPRMPTPTVRTPANTNAFADDVAQTMIVKDPKDQAQQIREQGKKFQVAMRN